MASVVLYPGPMEVETHREAYELLVEDLRSAGHDVHLKLPTEFRTGRGPSPEEIAGAALIVKLFDAAAQSIADGIIDAVRARLRARRRPMRPPREAEILGPDGQVLSRVELDDDAQLLSP